MSPAAEYSSTRAELREHIKRVLADGEWHTAYELVEGTCYRRAEATAVLRSMLRGATVEESIQPYKTGNTQRTQYRLRAVRVDDGVHPASVVATKRVTRWGNSLVLTVTEEADMLGLERGDAVRITIEKL